MSNFSEFESTYSYGKELGEKLERKRIEAIIKDWASERDLGIDALLAKIDNKPVVADEDFEISDLSAELRDWAQEIPDKNRFSKALKKVLERL